MCKQMSRVVNRTTSKKERKTPSWWMTLGKLSFYPLDKSDHSPGLQYKCECNEENSYNALLDKNHRLPRFKLNSRAGKYMNIIHGAQGARSLTVLIPDRYNVSRRESRFGRQADWLLGPRGDHGVITISGNCGLLSFHGNRRRADRLFHLVERGQQRALRNVAHNGSDQPANGERDVPA